MYHTLSCCIVQSVHRLLFSFYYAVSVYGILQVESSFPLSLYTSYHKLIHCRYIWYQTIKNAESSMQIMLICYDKYWGLIRDLIDLIKLRFLTLL